MKKGLITEIQKGSVHDGPGIRTVVFFKGCNMRCAWCHNPETVYAGKEILVDPEKCIGCGQCEAGCFARAKVDSGTEIGVNEMMDKIIEDKSYYGDTGGVTFSGGEPLLQSAFLYDVLLACKERGVHTVVETNLNADADTVKKIASACDMVFCDFKLFSDTRHIKFTGVSNEKIVTNLQNIYEHGCAYFVRTPVIAGVNSDTDEMEKMFSFVSFLKNLEYYELLSFHPLGQAKPKSNYFMPVQFERLSKEAMHSLGQMAASAGMKVKVDNIFI